MYRVEIDFLNVTVRPQGGNGHKKIGQRAQIGTGAPPQGVQQGAATDLVNHRHCFGASEGRRAVRHVGKRLDHHAAQAEAHHRAKYRIAVKSDHHFDPLPLFHPLDQGAVQLVAPRGKLRGHFVPGHGERVSIRQPDGHGPGFRFV